MAAPGARLGVGVSGGADSVALLHALARLGYELTVLHVNHRLRGAESDGDEAFVEALARRLGLAYEAERVTVAAAGGNLEAAARAARREFFTVARARHGLAAVAVGHTRSDQAETVLFRILRGAGNRGLRGILPVTREGVVRPLIEVSRGEVRAWLEMLGESWREDASNADARFARNRIRGGLLPELAREWNPRIEEALGHLAALAYEEERYWDRVTRAAFGRLFWEECGGWVAEEAALGRLPRALARRVVGEALRRVRVRGHEVEFGHIEAALDAGKRRVSLPGAEVERSFERVRIAAPGAGRCSYRVVVDRAGEFAGPWGRIRVETGVYNQGGSSLKDLFAGGLILRSWRPGDAYRPAAAARPVKLKDLFQRARIPSWQRPSWPVLTKGEEILWAKQFGPAEGFPLEIRFRENDGG